jgi:RHS repeat-associated protein
MLPRIAAILGGTPVWRAEQLPFGGVWSLPVSAVQNNLWFPGQYFDGESDRHYNFFRNFAPRHGRFAEPDPLGLETTVNVDP